MNPKRLTIRALRATGKANEQAELLFKPGANAIVGPSNTGKTFVFEAIDFVLGSGEKLRKLPEGKAFANLQLDFDASDGPSFRLRRAMKGGAIELTEFADGFDQNGTRSLKLAAKHLPDSEKSLSAYLLNRIGLEGRQLRTNKDGAKCALSFRLLTDLILVDELRIIKKASPILTGQNTTPTREKSQFGFFLTGEDDSDVVPQESKKNRNSRLAIEASVVESLLQERQKSYPTSAAPSSVSEQAARLDATIKSATSVVFSAQNEINAIIAERRRLIESRTALASRAIFVQEQRKRLRLLNDYYVTDGERLLAVIEATRTYHEMPEGVCPLCSGTIAVPASIGQFTHEDFEAACSQELSKIQVLRTDLKKAIADTQEESESVTEQQNFVAAELASIEQTLQQTLTPAIQASQRELDELVRQRTDLARSESMASTIQSLQSRLTDIEQLRKEPVSKSEFAERVTTATTADFCTIVGDLLEAWNYPQRGKVSFDTDSCDLVIGEKDRRDNGKGYRAITYAAFTIGLMKYCHSKNIPHPGFVVLDTPLNPYKAAKQSDGDNNTEDDDESGKLPVDVKSAFWKFIAEDDSGDQYIVIENESPPDNVVPTMKCHFFSGVTGTDRYGFFP